MFLFFFCIFSGLQRFRWRRSHSHSLTALSGCRDTYVCVGWRCYDQRLLGGYGVAWSSGMRSTSYRIKIGESSKMQSEYVWKYISTGISECRIWEMHLWILPINRKRNYQILTYLTYAFSHTYNNTPLTIPHSKNKVNFMIMSISTERNKS